MEYRRTLDVLLGAEGGKIISDNSFAFKLSNTVKTPEDLIDLIHSRVILPSAKDGGIVFPHIVGINRKEQTCFIFFYAPILKAFNGKVAGLVDVLQSILGAKGCDLTAFIAGSRGSSLGPLAAVSAYDITAKTMARRAFSWGNGAVHEFELVMELYEEIFSRTFDSDIWTSDDVWKDRKIPSQEKGGFMAEAKEDLEKVVGAHGKGT